MKIKGKVLPLIIIASALSCNSGTNDFNNLFTGSTLRIDYHSIGTQSEERAELISLSRTSAWAGPQKNLVDTMDYGEYHIVLKDYNSDKILYSKGFCTLFGEWRTTDEAKYKTEKYYSSQSIPMPKRHSIVEIKCRKRSTMQFEVIGTFDIKPSEIPECNTPANRVTDIKINGNPTEKVDLTFLAEGYRKEEENKFINDVHRFTDTLFKCPPFDKFQKDFNVRAVMLESDSSGVDHPGLGIYRSTALNSNYYTFGTDRYLTTNDMKSIADATWDVPTDAIFILANEPVYGGGGIYNFYAIGSTDDKRTMGVFIHEFGHSFGALADEYFYKETPYGEDAFYCLSCEPWEPNITTLVNFDRKWKDMLPESAEIPTISKDSIPELGVFEGGGYLSKGIFRPSDHCMMRDYAPFCKACTRSIVRIINFTCDRQD